MTLPRERSQALHNTREFLRALLNPKETPRVPRSIRREAYWCLRHFPCNYEIDRAAGKCPEVFGKVITENKNENSD